MKRCLVVILALVASGSVMAQGRGREPFRIPIRHADPWMIKAMLEGIPVRSPEMSTMPGFAGIAASGANAAAGKLLQDGFLMVNPTDNSLWYYPNKS